MSTRSLVLVLLAWLGAVGAVALGQGFPTGLLLGTWFEGASLFVGALVMLPMALFAWRRGPRPRRAVLLLVLLAAASWYPLGWLVFWQRFAPSMTLGAYVDWMLATIKLHEQHTFMGLTVHDVVKAADRGWLVECWEMAVAGSVAVALLPFARRGCADCDAPVRTTILGWMPWSWKPGSNPVASCRELGAAWLAQPTALERGPAPGGRLTLALRCCTRGHDPTLAGMAVSPPKITVKNVDIARVPMAEVAGLRITAGATVPADAVEG